MIKKLISLFLCMMLCVTGISIFVNAAEAEDVSIILQVDNSNMTVNGVEKEIDAAPVIIDGRTLLPVRAVVEEIGGNVSWSSEIGQATLNHGDNTIVLTIGSETALLNNEKQKLDTAPVIISGRTFLPIRFIAESFGYDVEWKNTDKTVTITKTGEIVSPEASETVEAATETTTEKVESTEGENILIVYFSRTGTTKELAENIYSKIGGDIAEITPVIPYPEDYNQCIEQAQNEIREDARPEYTINIDDISKYDTILVGYPIWWSSVPPVVRTFLENNDLSGKRIMPFCTHGGSGISGSMSNIRELCPNSDITEGLDESNDSAVNAWLSENGLN